MAKGSSKGTLSMDEFLSQSGQTRVKEVSFEQGLSLMEELVQKVESGELPLEEAIRAYERGAELLKHLRSLLSGAEEKLRILQKPGE